MRRRLPAIGAAIAGLVLAAGTATASAQEDDTADPAAAPEFDFRTGDTVATGLTIPWGLTFLPDGTSGIVAERNSGDVLRVGYGAEPVVLGNLDVVGGTGPLDERGLLGLAVSPTFSTDGWIYAYLSTEEDNRVVRFTLDRFEPETVLTGIPSALNHNGGRLAFGPDDKLYVSTGDANDSANSQDLDSLGGKILRLEPDGSIPEDNPFEDSPVYTWGNRNVQGMTWGPEGEMYFSELGQNTWDELNLAEPGANYGWPEVEGTGGDPEFTDPLLTWSTAEASPSGAEVVGDTIYIAALRGQRLWTVPVAGGEVTGDPIAVLDGTIGRVRTVELGPDGWLWVTTSNGDGTDKVIRYRPIGGTE
ncbi:PQQ-dependent sugar dehydrogenase [Glycomyces paridis]|uniref:PQQ-dependent sugar dehydrogenase n=1 Tax=Glycomyces paridis TaxID=2126555 RepID=A0A4S8PIZ2_9ACTN|nr:PQQ-dependent sugar dehydrogenase [Glycomyces paridis]THV30640.1 PQQ-dependent sugar dehydrogenase [Glycomyces paridis]